MAFIDYFMVFVELLKRPREKRIGSKTIGQNATTSRIFRIPNSTETGRKKTTLQSAFLLLLIGAPVYLASVTFYENSLSDGMEMSTLCSVQKTFKFDSLFETKIVTIRQ